ncbi:MAG: hypothetical protein ACI4R9_05165 [Kiritimatiellia bacterium]
MKKLLFLSMMAAANLPFAGRADENRVNLWPLVSYEDGALDVVWPLGHFKDADEWRFFPIVRDRHLFTVFPELWFTNEGFAILPLATEYDFGSGTVFPVLWWNLEGPNKSHSVFPLYYYHRRENATTFWAGCGLVGYNRRGNTTDHWLLPIYAKTPGSFYSIPYSHVKEGYCYSDYYFMGLGGRTMNADGETTSTWCFPLWHKDNRSFTSLPYHYTWNAQGEIQSWVSPLALSAAWQEGTIWKERYLFGLGGRNVNKDKDLCESWCVPFYYANNVGTFVTPLYGQTEKAAWGLPGWYRDTHSFASPLWYHHTDAQGRLDRWMIPLLLSGGVYRDGVSKNGFLLNIAGYMSDDNGYAASWCVPLYFKDNDGTFITPLYGYSKTSQWCFPLWYCDEKSLFSLAWCQQNNSDGSLESWAAPLLLSGGKTRADGSRETKILLGLGGATWGGRGGKCSSWVFPFYYENSEGNFATLLGGKTKDSSWVFPLFYTDKESFVSVPYAHTRDQVKKSDTYVIAPLFSGVTKYDSGASKMSALLLYGHGTDAQGKIEHDYLLPLYYYNGKNGDFTSVLYGRNTRGSHTNTWWATPLVGTRSGSKTGGWFFPFFNREKDVSFDQDLARLDAKTIPDDITFKCEVMCWTNRQDKTVWAWTNHVACVDVNSSIKGSVLLGSDHDQSVYGYTREKEYELSYHSKQGNRIFFNNESNRRVTYDKRTRQRTNEILDSETMALCGLFHHEHESNAQKGTSHTRTRVLWKLWEREEKNGNVTIDAFPGFTYDSKTNGYSKTSFLWRFFRCETDPRTGTKVDLFFIPVWR